jgi:hypothetical protein
MLLEDLERVYTACEELRRAMKNAAPNGRDYYPLDGGLPGGLRLCAAEKQYRHRMKMLDAIQDEVEAIVGGINDQH